ncbi:FAD-dependent oxidoreductase [Neomoorella humiferrea]|uniref:FAD-dependent oxidoreductase n=1 Tax=Neomoorella humiferrea TaxID=676965 RepID=UPI003D8B917F
MARFIKLHKRDVIVIGGGSTGIAAALSAARLGTKVILLEKGSALGGIAAMGYCFHTFYSHTGKQVVHGIAQEIIEDLVNLKAAVGHVRWPGGRLYAVTALDQEILRVVETEKLLEAGVDLLYHSLVKDVLMDGTKICGVVVQNRSETIVIPGEIIIDASGEGDVAAMSGAPYEKGRGDGKMQPVSMMLRMTNVDLEKVAATVPVDLPVLRSIKPGGQKPSPMYISALLTPWEKIYLQMGLFGDSNHQMFINSIWENEANINISRLVNFDATDFDQASKAESAGRLEAYKIYRFLRENIPGFEKSNMIASQGVGVRETRRFVGEYVLSEEDVLKGAKFDDCIGRSAYPIDIHDPEGKGVKFTEIGGDGAYDIPYRCLLPQKVENLLIAGRIVSATHKALGSVRSITSCLVMGQAVGVAAALCVKENKSPRALSVKLLQEYLRGQNVNLGQPELENDRKFLVEVE